MCDETVGVEAEALQLHDELWEVAVQIILSMSRQVVCKSDVVRLLAFYLCFYKRLVAFLADLIEVV